jgi:hypothetical protein
MYFILRKKLYESKVRGAFWLEVESKVYISARRLCIYMKYFVCTWELRKTFCMELTNNVSVYSYDGLKGHILFIFLKNAL